MRHQRGWAGESVCEGSAGPREAVGFYVSEEGGSGLGCARVRLTAVPALAVRTKAEEGRAARSRCGILVRDGQCGRRLGSLVGPLQVLERI